MLSGLGATDQGFDGFFFGDGFSAHGEAFVLFPFGGHGYRDSTGIGSRYQRVLLGLGRSSVLTRIGGLQEFFAPGRRQGCAEDDDRALKVDEFADEGGDERAGVNVVGMDFVKNDDLAGEGETPNEEVLYGHDALQGLVDGADAVWRKQRVFG